MQAAFPQSIAVDLTNGPPGPPMPSFGPIPSASPAPGGSPAKKSNAGMIAGIAIGAVVGLAVIGAGLFYAIRSGMCGGGGSDDGGYYSSQQYSQMLD